MAVDGDSEPLLARLASDVAAAGYAIVNGFLSPLSVAGLAARALALDAAGLLCPVAALDPAARAAREDIRGDRVGWLDPVSGDESEAMLFETFERLRLEMNRTLQLGLFDFEAHYAIDSPGTVHARRRDASSDESRFRGRRVLSCMLYLNVGWRTTDGGALRLHLDGETSVDAAPEAGKLVVFLSDRFEQEVLAARRERLSITGWFRRRPTFAA